MLKVIRHEDTNVILDIYNKIKKTIEVFKRYDYTITIEIKDANTLIVNGTRNIKTDCKEVFD